jgi:hypothetical protein
VGEERLTGTFPANSSGAAKSCPKGLIDKDHEGPRTRHAQIEEYISPQLIASQERHAP